LNEGRIGVSQEPPVEGSRRVGITIVEDEDRDGHYRVATVMVRIEEEQAST
jgi:hypothetical protein